MPGVRPVNVAVMAGTTHPRSSVRALAEALGVPLTVLARLVEGDRR